MIMITIMILVDQRSGMPLFGIQTQIIWRQGLINHLIRITDVMDGEICGSLGFMEPNCISYNFKLFASQTGVHKCELNNSTHEGHEEELKDNPNYLYRGAKVTIVTFVSPHTHKNIFIFENRLSMSPIQPLL